MSWWRKLGEELKINGEKGEEKEREETEVEIKNGGRCCSSVVPP